MGKLRIRVSIFIVTVILIIISVSAEACGAFDDTANGNWNDGATWGNTSPGVEGIDYPGADDDVTIDSHTVTLTADAAGNNITIASGGTLTAQNYTLTVSGNWDSSTGTFNYDTGTLKMTGSGKTLTHAGGWATRLYNLTIDTGASITHTGGVSGIANDITLADNSTLTLTLHTFHSEESGTGDLTIGSGATLAIKYKFYHFISDSSSHISTSGTITKTTAYAMFIYSAKSGSTAAPVTARTYDCDVVIAGGSAGDVAVLGGGASLNLGSNNLYIYDKGQLAGDIGILDNPSNIPVVSTGTLEIGKLEGGLSGKLIARSASYQFGSVTVQITGELDGTTGSGASTWNVSGNVTMNADSTFNAGGSTWNVGGNWTKNGGTFSAGTSTINLTGTNQTITGSSTFYNLTKTVTTARTLTFGASSTTTITGTATLQGASGQPLSLRSSTTGTRWNFTLNSGAAKNISYVDVKDSNASSSHSSLKPVSPTNSSSSGNNIQWFAYQPDAMIKLSAEADGSYLTDNTYETTVTVQTKSGGAISGSAAAYSVKFANDSAETDSLVITGTGDASDFTVQYLDDTSTDRTAAVTGAGYTISSLASGASKVWTLNVTPSGSPSPVAGGTSYNVFVTATSSNDSGAMDQVKGATTSSSANLTLVKSVDKATADPVEDLTYSVTATNASGLTDASGIILIDTIPSYTGFKVGSAAFNAVTSTLAAAISYSNDNGSTWTYSPSSGACSAPAGYDYCVTNIKWTMTGDMPSDTDFSTEFVARVQ